jgi:hypothetical protein
MDAARSARSRPRSARLVVFVSDAPRYREAKLATALKDSGWEVLLLSKRAPVGETAACYSRTERYKDAWEALELAARHRPIVYHVFSNWFYETGAAFVRARPGKIVFDPNDILAGLIKPELLQSHYPGETRLERYCLENADGICCRCMDTQYVKKHLGYRFKGKRLFYPDFTVGVPPESQDRPPLEGIHVIHMGSIAIRRHQPLEEGYHWEDIAEALSRGGVHFHLYGGGNVPRVPYEDLYADYLALQQKTEFFHLHRELPMTALIGEMRRYTFGVLLAGTRLHLGEHDEVSTKARYDHTLPSRIFEHLAGGLPVVLHEGRFLFWFTKRLGKAVAVDSGFLDRPLEWLKERLPTPKEKQKLSQAWKQVDVKTHIQRLIRYYESVASR